MPPPPPLLLCEQSEFDSKKKKKPLIVLIWGRGGVLIARLLMLVVKCIVGSDLSLMSCLSSMTRVPSSCVLSFFNFENILLFLSPLSRKRATAAG